MTQITRRDIVAHQSTVPWPNARQVEQDLLLCRAMTAIFKDEFLKTQVAMRGGTLLHKVHLAPASRYSEDIDLVVIGDRPKEHIEKAINRVLAHTLGSPKKSIWRFVKLAVRNIVRPSEILQQTYSVPSLTDPQGAPLEIVVEANVSERTPHRPIVQLPFSYPFRGESVSVRITGYDIHEMLGTKMRAMFQRRRGRDLFDLYWALQYSQIAIVPSEIIDSFLHYMAQENTNAERAELIELLRGHLRDSGFLNDMRPLLRTGLHYDPLEAGEYVISRLLDLLPAQP